MTPSGGALTFYNGSPEGCRAATTAKISMVADNTIEIDWADAPVKQQVLYPGDSLEFTMNFELDESGLKLLNVVAAGRRAEFEALGPMVQEGP